ncbi:MAG: flippase [Chloroflexi bacterium]|nr:flippase [Chloroflexota bacterium]
MNFATRVLGTLGTNILTFIFTASATVLIARVLGPEGKGVLTLVFLAQVVLVAALNMGIASSNNYYSASGKHKLSDLAGNSFVLAGVIGVLVSAAFVLFLRFSPLDLFPGVNLLYMYVVAAAVPFSLLNLYLSGILFGKLAIRQINLVGILVSLVSLIGVVPIFFLGLKQGILWLISLTIAVQVITSLLYMVVLRKLTEYSLRFDSQVFKATAAYGLKSHIASLSSFLHFKVDQFIVGYFLGATQVGFYAVAVLFTDALFFVPRATSSILFPQVASSTSASGAEFTARVCRYTVLISLILCGFFAACANLLVRGIYGAPFSPAVKPLLILLPGVFLMSFAGILSSYVSGSGRVIFATYGSLTAVAVNIALNFFLIPRMGITGAALASTISYSLETIYITIVFMLLSKKSFSQTFIPKLQDLRDLGEQVMKYLHGGRKFVEQRWGN